MLMCQLNLCYTMNTQKNNQEEGMQLLDDPFGKSGDSVDQKKVLDHIP